MDNRLRVSLRKKPVFNLMLGYDAQTDSVEFAYPWIRPVHARLTFDREGFSFSFNKNYLRFSNWVGEGWELIDVFRSVFMFSLIGSGMYMVHGAAIELGPEGILIPSFANTGKTTTAWMLSKRGAKYLTDELAVLDSHGTCLSFPSSSLVTRRLAKSLGLNLTKGKTISMRVGDMKNKLLSARFASGGLRLYPADLFAVANSARITTIAFIQNGVDEIRKVPLEEAVTRLIAIRNFELGWDSNPYLVAESFFNPKFDLEQYRTQEKAFVKSFLSGLEDIYLISSSSGQHYAVLEQLISEKKLPAISN